MVSIRRAGRFQVLPGADGFLALQDFQTGERRRSAELVASVAVSMKKCFEFVMLAEKRVKDGLRGDRRGHRQIAAGQAFCEAEKIGLDIFAMAGKQRRTDVASVSNFLFRSAGD